MQNLANITLAQLEGQRFNAAQAGRPQFAAQTPAQRATELVARMDIARQHRNKAAFLEAQAELKALVEQM